MCETYSELQNCDGEPNCAIPRALWKEFETLENELRNLRKGAQKARARRKDGKQRLEQNGSESPQLRSRLERKASIVAGSEIIFFFKELRLHHPGKYELEQFRELTGSHSALVANQQQ